MGSSKEVGVGGYVAAQHCKKCVGQPFFLRAWVMCVHSLVRSSGEDIREVARKKGGFFVCEGVVGE